MKIASILEILLINNKSGISTKTKQPFSINEAHCVLRNEDGSPGAVGVLVVPKSLEDKAKVGLFTASFGLVAGSFGETQGRIIAQLTDLTPIAASAINRVPSRPVV
jgi:hypothetical protein